ncbi:hypothetical protein APHAL10511_003181 [Amanita phalloides]|nr:hypothetical protein APHAL10511_003181 [Amanita phalloides]
MILSVTNAHGAPANCPQDLACPSPRYPLEGGAAAPTVKNAADHQHHPRRLVASGDRRTPMLVRANTSALSRKLHPIQDADKGHAVSPYDNCSMNCKREHGEDTGDDNILHPKNVGKASLWLNQAKRSKGSSRRLDGVGSGFPVQDNVNGSGSGNENSPRDKADGDPNGYINEDGPKGIAEGGSSGSANGSSPDGNTNGNSPTNGDAGADRNSFWTWNRNSNDNHNGNPNGNGNSSDNGDGSGNSNGDGTQGGGSPGSGGTETSGGGGTGTSSTPNGAGISTSATPSDGGTRTLTTPSGGTRTLTTPSDGGTKTSSTPSNGGTRTAGTVPSGGGTRTSGTPSGGVGDSNGSMSPSRSSVALDDFGSASGMVLNSNPSPTPSSSGSSGNGKERTSDGQVNSNGNTPSVTNHGAGSPTPARGIVTASQTGSNKGHGAHPEPSLNSGWTTISSVSSFTSIGITTMTFTSGSSVFTTTRPTTTTGVTTISIATDLPEKTPQHHSSAGTIAGTFLGSIFGLLLVLVLFLCYRRKRQKQRSVGFLYLTPGPDTKFTDRFHVNAPLNTKPKLAKRNMSSVQISSPVLNIELSHQGVPSSRIPASEPLPRQNIDISSSTVMKEVLNRPGTSSLPSIRLHSLQNKPGPPSRNLAHKPVTDTGISQPDLTGFDMITFPSVPASNTLLDVNRSSQDTTRERQLRPSMSGLDFSHFSAGSATTTQPKNTSTDIQTIENPFDDIFQIQLSSIMATR